MQGKQVLLTGGTGGLALGVTPSLLSLGVELTIPYISSREVERLKGFVSPANLARIRFVESNLNDEAAVEKLVNGLPRVDVLIHLVGGFSMVSTHEYSFAD